MILKIFVLVGTLLSLGAKADACPLSLLHYHTKNLKGYDLCLAHDRYQLALHALKWRSGENPLRVENLQAPRFINLPDWQKRDSKLPMPYAYHIYNPAPVTWLDWDAGAAMIDSSAQHNYETKYIPPINSDWLKSIHGTSLNGIIATAGKFRTGPEFGLMINHPSALTERQASRISAVEYMQVANPLQRLINFTPLECLEEGPKTFLHDFLKQDHNTRTFDPQVWPRDVAPGYKTSSGEERTCGYVSYAALDEVQPQLSRWLDFVNENTGSWNENQISSDPILVAARAERWLIAIHPYEHGNGRVSRFVMDWILESLGLPAPLLKDQNDDLYSTENEWAQQVGNGIMRAIRAVENCAIHPSASGCDALPTAQATTGVGVTP